MKLTELEPQFLRYEAMHCGVSYHEVDTIVEAQGIVFLCPTCFEKNSGPVGTHMVLCWSRSRGVPDNATPGPGRWKLDGTDYNDLSLNADPPGEQRSVQFQIGCNAHFHVTNGEITKA